MRRTAILGGVVGLAAIVYGVTVLVVDLSTSKARDQATEIYQSIRDELALVVDETRKNLDDLAENPSVSDGDPQLCAEQLKGMLDRHVEKNDVFLRIRSDGQLDCTPAGPASVDLSERVYFTKAMEERGFVIGEFLVGKVSNEPVLAVARPILDDQGVPTHVLVAGIKTGWLEDLIQNSRSDADLLIEIQDASGVLMSYFTNKDRAENISRSRTELIRLPLFPDRSDAQIVVFERT